MCCNTENKHCDRCMSLFLHRFFLLQYVEKAILRINFYGLNHFSLVAASPTWWFPAFYIEFLWVLNWTVGSQSNRLLTGGITCRIQWKWNHYMKNSNWSFQLHDSHDSNTQTRLGSTGRIIQQHLLHIITQISRILLHFIAFFLISSSSAAVTLFPLQHQ